jgi:hypothetical protein
MGEAGTPRIVPRGRSRAQFSRLIAGQQFLPARVDSANC